MVHHIVIYLLYNNWKHIVHDGTNAQCIGGMQRWALRVKKFKMMLLLIKLQKTKRVGTIFKVGSF